MEKRSEERNKGEILIFHPQVSIIIKVFALQLSDKFLWGKLVVL